MKHSRDISIDEALKMQADLYNDCFVAPFEDAQNNNAMKLPRKLKKAKKHFYLTKQWWDMKDDVKFKLLNRRFGVSGALWDIKLHQMDKPYPYTKWIRKYRVHLLKLRGKPTDWFFSGNYEIPT